MLNHLFLLKFKRRTTNADIGNLEKKLDELPNTITEIQMLEFGRNVVETPGSYDFAIWALFANKESLDRYLQHPRYRTVAQHIEGMSQRFITVDFYGSDAGSLRERPPVDWPPEEDYPDRLPDP